MVYTERTHWSSADLAALPEDGYHYELVIGRHIQMPPHDRRPRRGQQRSGHGAAPVRPAARRARLCRGNRIQPDATG